MDLNTARRVADAIMRADNACPAAGDHVLEAFNAEFPHFNWFWATADDVTCWSIVSVRERCT